MAVRIHLFPSRTQKLSSPVSTILGWRRPGKIERRRHILLYSSIAQSVERMTVNHDVTGSSPVGGAISEQSSLCSDFFLSLKEIRPAIQIGFDEGKIWAMLVGSKRLGEKCLLCGRFVFFFPQKAGFFGGPIDFLSVKLAGFFFVRNVSRCFVSLCRSIPQDFSVKNE